VDMKELRYRREERLVDGHGECLNGAQGGNKGNGASPTS
jgi:hypothetical protein